MRLIWWKKNSTLSKSQQQFLKALRSNEFEQGHGKLRVEIDGSIKMCCLGVACELYRRDTGRGTWKKQAAVGYSEFVLADACIEQNYLPRPVRDWLGIDQSNPYITIDGVQERAAIFNDGSPNLGINPKTFKQIANGFEELFKDGYR